MANILMIGKYYYPFKGGIESNTQAIAEYASRFHDVTVLVNSHEPGQSTETINGVRVIRRRVALTFKGQPIALGLMSGIRLSDYDVVHFHSPNPFASALYLAYATFYRRVPLVITHHMDIYGRALLRGISMPFARRMLRMAKSVIVTSRKNVRLSQDLPQDRHYSVVPLGIRENDYIIDEGIREQARAWRESLSGDAPVIGFFGRHARYKGLDVLVRAMVDLPNVHALIAGDGPYRESVQRLAHELGVANRITFLGFIDHATKLKMLAAIDCFVFPSTEITEAFGISQMEAMLCGVPVVASDLPTGVTDVAIHGQTALLAEPGNARDLGKRIATMLANRTLREEIAAAGAAHIRANMALEVIAKKTLNILEQACHDHPAPVGMAARGEAANL